MDKEGNAASAGNAGRSWDKSPVIVLPAGSAAAVWHQTPLYRPQQQPGAGPELLFVSEPPEKVFYKTRLCEKFEAGGRCAYEDGCSFAHGHAELRPPLPLPPAARRSRMVVPPVDTDGGGGRSGGVPFHYFGAGKVCFEFRDKGNCHFGDKCNFAHASPAPDMRFPKAPEPARRSATPPARAFAPGSSSIYPPASARAFPPGADDAAEQGEPKPTRLELLSRKKMSGIYGDWPEQF